MKTKKVKLVCFLVIFSLLLSVAAVYADTASTANNYTDFYSLLSKAVSTKSPAVTIKIIKYDKKVYDVQAALGKVMENSKGLKYCITQYKAVEKPTGGNAVLTINLTYENVDRYVSSYSEFSQAIGAAAANLQDSVKLRINKYDLNIYKTSAILEQKQKNYGELYYINDLKSSWAKSAIGNSGIMTVNLLYSSPKAVLVNRKADLDKKLNEIISKAIAFDMTEGDKELALHDYIIGHTQLTDSKYGQLGSDTATPYGVLVQGKGNSMGIAGAMQLLLKKAGIDSIVATGNSQAWNIVKIEGQYYHLDVTSDFWECESKFYAAHGYFNLTDEEMSRIHTWNRAAYPKCTSTEGNYFIMNKTIANNPEQFYELVKDSIIQVREYVSIKIPSFDERTYNISAVINQISNSSPELDYVNEWQWQSDKDMGVINLLITYDYPREKLLAMKKETQKKVKELVNKLIKPGMSDYEKQLAFHDYIILNAKYDYENVDKDSVPFEEHDAYGVLVKGIGVCDSYAEAMKMLLNEAGVECIVAEGKAISKIGSEDTKYGHAWNIIKLDGEYYHFDTTWDDVRYVDGSESLEYYFLNLTDEEAAGLYEWDENKYPKCTGTKYNYYGLNKQVVKNEAEFKNSIIKVLNKRGKGLNVKITSYKEIGLDIEGVIKEAFNKSSLGGRLRYSYTHMRELGIVKLEFQY